tara:strand:+ start:2737 stop:2916 length:180 start_codon:yes stop_codon:yes gene_type:complete
MNQELSCDHDDSVYWCIACGKEPIYENLCRECGSIGEWRRCLDCDEEFEVVAEGCNYDD